MVKELEAPVLETNTTNIVTLVLHNDDYNDFDFIIGSIIEICSYDTNRAMQIALIANNTGKCRTISGDKAFISEKHDMFKIRNIITTIE